MEGTKETHTEDYTRREHTHGGIHMKGTYTASFRPNTSSSNGMVALRQSLWDDCSGMMGDGCSNVGHSDGGYNCSDCESMALLFLRSGYRQLNY